MNEEPCHREAARGQSVSDVKATTRTLSSAQFKWRRLDEHTNIDIILRTSDDSYQKHQICNHLRTNVFQVLLSPASSYNCSWDCFRLNASGKTVGIHSLCGLPRRLTYRVVAGCNVQGISEVRCRALTGGARRTLPSCISCCCANNSIALLMRALRRTSTLDTREMKDGAIPRIWRMHLAWNPLIRRSSAIVKQHVARPYKNFDCTSPSNTRSFLFTDRAA